MSFIITTYVPEGIVMASDSRQTAVIEASDNTGKIQSKFELVTSDSCNKLFLLEEQNVGISVFGETILAGKPIEHAMRIFMQEHNNISDGIMTLVEKMMRYFSAKFPNADTAFHMTGYEIDENNVSVPHVYHGQVSRNEIQRLNVKAGTDLLLYGTAWGGQGDIIARLIQPNVKCAPVPGAPEMPNPPIIWDAMPVNDAIEFCEFAVNTTIQMTKFQARTKQVGGKPSILLITPNGAFWIKRKGQKIIQDDQYFIL